MMFSSRCARSMKAGDIVAKVYANLVRKGLKTIADVPEELKADVEKFLKEGSGQ